MASVTKIALDSQQTRKRVAAYCRVSTDSEAQLDSLENQMESFKFRLAMNPDWQLISTYVDEGITGTSVKNRAQFNQMVEDCKAGKIDYILTKSISRFARNTLDCVGYVRELQGYGVQICFDKEGIDTGEVTSEMLLTIMASFAQEESRSISENVKWGIRKRFEEGQEVKVPLYGFYHTEVELFMINDEEADIVREIYTRYAHGELPQSIMDDMVARGVKPPAGDKWKRLQLDRMLKNEKYVGDVILQKTYVENHLTHKQIRNRDGKVPQYHVTDAHPAIVDRHIFNQVQTVLAMRKVSNGNSTYPYGEMLRCPHCGRVLTHGSLNQFSYDGEKILNGGWGCYGEEGCGQYLVIQNVLDKALITAYAEKYGERMERVDYYWLDDNIASIQLGEDAVTITWKDGTETTAKLEFINPTFTPTSYASFYDDYLDRVRSGKVKNKYKNLMGLEKETTA